MPRTRKPKRQAGVRHINGVTYVRADLAPTKVASPVKPLKVEERVAYVSEKFTCVGNGKPGFTKACERKFGKAENFAQHNAWAHPAAK